MSLRRNPHPALRALLGVALALAALPAAAVVLPRGPEKPVAAGGNRQSTPSVLVVPSGSVLAWSEAARGLVVRWFDPAGEPLAPPRLLAESDPIPPLPFTRVPLRQHLEPALAGRADDAFLLAHTEQVVERSADIFFEERLLLSSRVVARLYAPDGRPLARPLELAPGVTRASRPALASADHGFWAAWQQAAGPEGIFVRKLNHRGRPLAPPVRVAEEGLLMSIASAGGRTLVVWVRGSEFMARLLGAEGEPLGAPFLLTTRRARLGSTASVAAQPDGEFLVAVQRSSHLNARIYGQRVSRDGARTGATLLLNAKTGDAYTEPQVVALSGGRWLVSWVTGVANFRIAVEYGVFDPAAAVALERGLFNERAISSQAVVALAAREGRVAAAWEGYDERNVRALRLRAFADEPPPQRPRRRR